eukprot:CAMPEP_0201595086 /NCGR_PEP_ID=MMETSP0190_2-20130828/192206_1 /ASSEMBLY_ACC=CAM_ASM_000263 /TAXON_ID=37353 /ORGANISM="Rosalina sp." /LENGTH=1189 /DNA_ID=CAMNT_0048054955 /DNA_START=1369 /DNA_END=4938 /DNA_ORIENTATION=+
MIQSGNALQQNNQSQILQQQQMLQQRYGNQNSQLLSNQSNIPQQAQPPQQHEPMGNPFMPNINQSNMHQQQGAKLSGVPSNNQPQSHPQSQAYGNFPGSPSQNITTQRGSSGSGGTLVISPSSQTTASNQSQNQQSPQQSYSARVISQPDLNSMQFQRLNITSPTKLQTQQLSQQAQSQPFSMTEQPVAAQSPQMPSNNNNNDSNYNFGALSMTQQNTDNTVVPSNYNIPNLEQPEQKQNQQHESKSQALNETTPASHTGHTQSTGHSGTTTSAMSPQTHLSQKHESETGTGSGTISDPEQPPTVAISDEVDDEQDQIIFQHRPARAWRWDADQEKYRGRGKGQMTIYYNKATGKARIIFYDEKNEKTRLLQYIDGKDQAKFFQTQKNSNNHPIDTKSDEVVWWAADYTMDVNTPMVGEWKMQFSENEDAAQQFIDAFNESIHSHDNNNNDGNQDTSATAPIDDQDDNKSNASTQPFDNNKPFAFDIQNEKPKDSFTDNPVNFSGGDNNNWSFKGFDNKNDTNTNGNNNNNNDTSSNNASGSGFGDINWSFDANKAQQPTEEKAEDKPVDDSKDTSAIGGGNDAEEEDNGSKYTFKPIVQLDEVDVASGHENEELIKEFGFVKLFRFGKDVTGHPGWKNRATNSKISFYKSKETGKIRMIAREQDTNKLRMNQNVSIPSKSNFSTPKDRMYSWSAYDTTIAAEEENETAGWSNWLIKFQSQEIGQQFQSIFDQASNNNGSVGSPVKSSKQESNEQEPQQPATPQLTNKSEEETQAQNDSNKQVEEEQQLNNNNEAGVNEEDDKYKGWSQEEIMADKQRLEKAKIDAKQAQLFGGGDNSQQVTSWNTNFDSNSNNNFGGGDGMNFTFSENQRGVDLQAEKELNRIKTDKNIQFGVTNDDNATNNTAQQGDNNTNNEQEEPSSLGIGSGFEFVNGDKNENDEKVTPKNEDATATATESPWNIGGGGFSSVQATGDAPTWGTENAGGDWGNFGAESNKFNFGALMSDKQTEDQTENNNDDNKDNGTGQDTSNNNDNNNGDDNGKEYTFKPLVQLNEVDVESGHENEKLLNTFEVAKVYRWGKDVTGHPGWKNRASNTKIGFYQSKDSGKIRIVCREDITNKLRLNQWIDKSIAKIDKKAAKQIGWHGVDSTIAAEDESNGLCSFAAKFRDGESADAFMKLLETSAENNEQLK